ncbi:MAG: sulfite exporter TauE/SafE family protein [Neisseria sp.]|nr:sulfite exporter TauE/SafE family protein [Neisseria sp.]
MDVVTLSTVLALCAGAGLLHGLCGIGFPMIATAVLATVMPFQQAVLLVWLPTLLVNLASVFSGSPVVQMMRRYAALAISSFIGSLFGAALLLVMSSTHLQLLLGVMIVLYVALTLSKPHWHLRDSLPLSIGFGVAAGVVGGATNAMSPLLMMYLLATVRSRNEIVQAANVCFLIGKVAQFLVLGTQFLRLSQGEIVLMAWITVLSLSCLVLGIKMRHRLSPRFFRGLVLVVLSVLAVKSLVGAAHSMVA